MFKDETLFILGAGADFPYGYPLGADLIANIITNIRKDHIYIPMSDNSVQDYLKNGNSLIQIDFNLDEIISSADTLASEKFKSEDKPVLNGLVSFNGKTYARIQLEKITQLANLKNALVEFDPVSIDAFLNHHPSYEQAGKAMIIYSLLKCENEFYFSRREKTTEKPYPDNWYSHLINDILSGCNNPSDIKNNKINIITFNYSMSLDYYLKKRLSAVGLLTDNTDAKTFIEELTTQKIHHVYGKIHDEIPIKEYGAFAGSNDINKDRNDAEKNTMRFMKSIKSRNLISLMYQERQATDTYQKLIHNAKKIIIIGFGFDRDNLNILGLPEKEKEYATLLLGRQLRYMDYEGRMKGLAEQFNSLKMKHQSLSITRSTANSITEAYQNDFKIYLY